MSIFSKTKKEEVKRDYFETPEYYEKEITKLNKHISKQDDIIEDLKESHRKEIDNLRKDQDIVLKRKDQEVDVVVQSKTNEMKAKIATLTLENGNYKKEVEILTKAFENLGFDVKDMKEILNKLVDGVVSKNKVQVIK